jgi:hypothetical protein
MPDLDALLAYAAGKPGLTLLRVPDRDLRQDNDPVHLLLGQAPEPWKPAVNEPAWERRLRRIIRLQELGKLRVYEDPVAGGQPRQLTVRREAQLDRDGPGGPRLVVGYRVVTAADHVPLSGAARGYALAPGASVSHGWTSAQAEVNPAVIDPAQRRRPSARLGQERLPPRPDGRQALIARPDLDGQAKDQEAKATPEVLRKAKLTEFEAAAERLDDLDLAHDVRIPGYLRDGGAWGGASVVLRARGEILQRIADEIKPGLPATALPGEDLPHVLRHSPLEVSGDGGWFSVRYGHSTYVFRLRVWPRGDWMTMSDEVEKLRIDVTNQGISSTGNSVTHGSAVAVAVGSPVGPALAGIGPVFTVYGDLTFSTASTLGRVDQYTGLTSARADSDKGQRFLAGVNVELAIAEFKDGEEFDPRKFQEAISHPRRFAVDRGAEVKLPHDVTLTRAGEQAALAAARQAAVDAWKAAHPDVAHQAQALEAARNAAVAPENITFAENVTTGPLSVPVAVLSLDEVRAYLLGKLHAKSAALTAKSKSTEARLPREATAEVIRFISQHNIRAHHREASTAVIASKMIYTSVLNLKGAPGLGRHDVPLGSVELRMRPREAVLLKQYAGTELRGAVPAVTGAARRRTDVGVGSLGWAAGVGSTPSVTTYLKLRLAALAGFRYLVSRSRFLNTGGSAAVNQMLNAKGQQTAMYQVEHQVQVRAFGDAWSEPFTVYTWEHMTVEDARRLAAHSPQFSKRAAEPEPPDYLLRDHPAALGLAFGDVTFREGGHFRKKFSRNDDGTPAVDGNGKPVVEGYESLVETYTDYLVRRIAARYPDLVQPPEALDLIKFRNSLAKGNLARLVSEYDESRFLRLAANLEKIRTEVRGALLNNPQGLLTGRHDDRLTGTERKDEITRRLVTQGVPLVLKLAGVTRNKRLVLTLHGTMTKRRYAGTAESFGLRSGTIGRADQSGGYQTTRGVEGTFDASAQLRDAAADAVNQSRSYGGLSLGVRGGWQWRRTMGFGGNVQDVTVGVVQGPLHAWAYDLDLNAHVGGFARPKRWLRYLSLGIASWNRWVRELEVRDDPFRGPGGDAVEPVRAVITLLTPDSHSRRERLPPPGRPSSQPLSAALTNWLLSGQRRPESARDKAFQEKLAGIMKLPFHASSHELTRAVIDLGAEVTENSAPYARTGADGVNAVRDTFEHLAANLGQLTGLSAWPLSGFITRQAVGEWQVRYQVNRSLSNLQLVSDPAKKSELELSVLSERGASGGKSRVAWLSFGLSGSGTTNTGPEGTPDAMLSGGFSWTWWARQWATGQSYSVSAVRDTNFIPTGPAYLVRADATDYVAAEGVRTVAGRRVPGRSVRRAGKMVKDPGSVYFYVTEEEAYELGLLRRHPTDEGRALDQPWRLKPEVEQRPVAAFVRKQPDLWTFIAKVRAELARQGFDVTDIDAVEAHLSTLSIDAHFLEMARGEVPVPLGHFGAKGMVAVSLKERGDARFAGRDGPVKWQHRVHALIAKVNSRATAKGGGLGLSFSVSKRQENERAFAEGGGTAFATSNQSARGQDKTLMEQRSYQVTDQSSGVLFDHDYDVVVITRVAGREQRLSVPGTFRVAHPLSSADPVLPALVDVDQAAATVKTPDPVTRSLGYATATKAGVEQWLGDHGGRVHHLLGARGHLRPVPMDTIGQQAVTAAVRRAVAASERSFPGPRSGLSEVIGDYDLGADGLTKHGSQSDEAIRNATTSHNLGAFLQEALWRKGKLGGTGYRVPGVMRRGTSAVVTLYAKAGFPRDAKIVAYDPNLRIEKPARLVTGTDVSATETSAGAATPGPVVSAATGLGNANPGGTAGMATLEAVADTVPASELVSQNEKLTGPAYLIDIPVTWLAVAEVEHQAADHLTGGTSTPRAFAAETYVRCWLDEGKAIELGFVTLAANEETKALNLMAAEESVRTALDRYWDARRALLNVPHEESALTADHKKLIADAGQTWAKVAAAEEEHRRVRVRVQPVLDEMNVGLAAVEPFHGSTA